MSAFERLHPAVQYHVVNSLGWRDLRPTQLAAIEPILEGMDCLLLAPTAGGKTEAAVLPVLSRMLAESWMGLSVLYLCPIKALLNNLESRLSHYLGLVGRRVGVWHGDVPASVKRRILAEPPDLLLTTPESLEGMLISRKIEHVPLLVGVRTVVVDELHAFAADDRGWHVRAVLTRLRALGTSSCQIIGLSATVGNPERMIGWLTQNRDAVCIGRSVISHDADVQIDQVESSENAAIVLSRLYVGEKRLVFCDSRSRVESIAQELRRRGTRVLVSHSSLSADARRQAEAAFAEERDCIIIATSTLELGIDVGDLERVIQIDAPSSVSSFLQRMGRTGRRAGARRNCLFLTTGPEAFLLACGITRLWRQGFIEDVAPPKSPWHVALQQVLAILLEQGALSVSALSAKLAQAFPELPGEKLQALLSHLEATGVLSRLEGLVHLGSEGERKFGRRNFLDLTSVFVSSPDFLVFHGRREIGYVSPSVLIQDDGEPVTLSLGGHAWRLTAVEWRHRQAWVEPQESAATTRWAARGRPLGYAVMQAVRDVLQDGAVGARLTRRGRDCLAVQRERFGFLGDSKGPVAVCESGAIRLWTFAGLGANFAVARFLRREGIPTGKCDDFGISGVRSTVESTRHAMGRLAEGNTEIDVGRAELGGEVKFGEALPGHLEQEVMAGRILDVRAAREMCSTPLVDVKGGR